MLQKSCKLGETTSTEVGIYERKQESNKTRKYAFDQENDQEKKKENTLSTKKATKKKKEKPFFLYFLLSFKNSHLSS